MIFNHDTERPACFPYLLVLFCKKFTVKRQILCFRTTKCLLLCTGIFDIDIRISDWGDE